MSSPSFTTVEQTGHARAKQMEAIFHLDRLETNTMQARNQTLEERVKNCQEGGLRQGGTATCAVHVAARTNASVRDEECFHRNLTHSRLDYHGKCSPHNASTKSGNCTGN